MSKSASGWAVFVLTMTIMVAESVTASALELEQARESCRASIGRPTYLACTDKGGSHDSCMARAKEAATPCVRNAMIAAHPKAELFDADKVSAPKPGKDDAAIAAQVAKAPVTLVAPPRTISDVTAILDQQKPDPAKIAALTATADADVPAGLKPFDLASFYYKRAQARLLLGRNADALADAELAVKNGDGDDYKNVVSRYEQFLMRRLQDNGDSKRGNAIALKQIAAFSTQAKGKLFGPL